MAKAQTGVIRGKQEEKCLVSKQCKSDPKFVGIDLSYTATGLIVLDSKGEILEQKLIKTSKSDSKFDIEDRLIRIENDVKFVPNIMGLASVYIEGPAFASQGNAALQMGALNFFVRTFLRKKEVDYKIIAPPTLKKWVTGSGRADKKQMIDKVEERWNIKFKDNNLADAYGLARMAMEEYKNG
jgi:Holliday junction resolvasome RuvABC endonuclease subunit